MGALLPFLNSFLPVCFVAKLLVSTQVVHHSVKLFPVLEGIQENAQVKCRDKIQKKTKQTNMDVTISQISSLLSLRLVVRRSADLAELARV